MVSINNAGGSPPRAKRDTKLIPSDLQLREGISVCLTWLWLVRRLPSHMCTDIYMWVCVHVLKSLAFVKACYLHSESPVDYKDHLSLHFQLFIHILTWAFHFHYPRSWTSFLWLSKEVSKWQTFPRWTVMQMLYSSAVHCLEFLTSTVFGHFCTFKSHVKMYESLMNCIDKLLNHVICTQMLLELFSELTIFKYF